MKHIPQAERAARFHDIEEYFRVMIAKREAFFSDELTGKTNLQSVVIAEELLTT